jgi:hypothetical protein
MDSRMGPGLVEQQKNALPEASLPSFANHCLPFLPLRVTESYTSCFGSSFLMMFKDRSLGSLEHSEHNL